MEKTMILYDVGLGQPTGEVGHSQGMGWQKEEGIFGFHQELNDMSISAEKISKYLEFLRRI
ncbi:hypothetical protein ACLOJK_025004 [Asimina triloba]